MRKICQFSILSSMITVSCNLGCFVTAQEQPLFLAYPPDHHQTQSATIFFIGTASPSGEVTINNQPIQRSKAGHFAPSFPLQMGDNTFVLRHNNQEIQIKITRVSAQSEPLLGVAFAKDSLTPKQDIARFPGELICFSAIAPQNATVTAQLKRQTIPLLPQVKTVELPPNSAVLTAQNQVVASVTGQYQGCTSFAEPGNLGRPVFQLSLNNQTITQAATGTVEILPPERLQVIEVVTKTGTARTGPSSDYSRLTPLPQGTVAAVTGKEGEWLRLDYGAWIAQKETQFMTNAIAPHSLIRSITSRKVDGATEIIFPLQIPVPVSIQQGTQTLTLSLYNTTAQTDTIRLDDDPVIQRLDWQQVSPKQVDYTFNLKSKQQWGYDLRYQGTSLILSLRHPPRLVNSQTRPLEGIKILLDPGHGGKETGAIGPTGYPEKAVTLTVAKLLEQALSDRGATVYLTRETDTDVSLQERVDLIDRLKPAISLSLHYNALPDGGDAIKTDGVSTFWYHPQAHDLAIFLENYLVQALKRPSYGVFWNNLALTRPQIAPAVLLELGFIINPEEFEWIANPQEQQRLAKTLADGITQWFEEVK